jgi:hypothetical protein
VIEEHGRACPRVATTSEKTDQRENRCRERAVLLRSDTEGIGFAWRESERGAMVQSDSYDGASPIMDAAAFARVRVRRRPAKRSAA